MKAILLALAALFLFLLVTRGHMLMYFRFSVLELLGFLIVIIFGMYIIVRHK